MIQPSARSELVSYPIRDIVIEAKRLEKQQGIKMAYLNIGDPAPFGFRPPKHVLDAVAQALSQNYSGYAPSEGDPELRKEAAKYEGVAEGDVFITSGLSEGIDFLFQALVDPGRNILLPLPTYPLYSTKQRLSYGPVDFYNCDENYEPDIDDMGKKISPYTRAILVINPNNPTGKVYSRKTLEKIVDVAGEHKLPIIADDAYEHIILDGSDYINLRKIHKDVPIVSGNSLSKNFIYPGARVGYVAFHGEWGEEMKDAMQRLCNQRLSVNWEMQRGYIAALRGPMDHVRQFNAELRKRREVLVKRVAGIDGLHVVKPGGAFYAFVKVESRRWKNDWEFARALLRKGVVVVPGSGFGPMPNIFFRMVFLASVEQLNHAFDRVEELMKGK